MGKQRVKIGIVGCGNISRAYLMTAQSFPILEVAAVADIDLKRAQARADEYFVPKACTVKDLLADPEIEIVVNLTIPAAHAEVALQAIKAKKHFFNEKPFAVKLADGQKMVAEAKKAKVRTGCAPGTFLGGGLQTCRKLIDEGAIGQPLSATAFMMSPGHESWHPDPEFYYKVGGGPMFDMGPYYLTALLNMLGPARRVAGSATIQRPERTITSEPKKGTTIKVETPDHVTGIVEFKSGAVATMVTSFAVWHANLPRIEVYGTEGTLSMPDPNSLGGPVKLRKAGEKEWQEVKLTHGHDGGGKWGIGVVDMAYAIRSGRPHRATGENALHVLEIMHAFLGSGKKGAFVKIAAPYRRPEPLPAGLGPMALDD
ncbi:MAG: Gfo/Idh/MocA family oxidoreductase [Planctomycetota bacterium]|nr:Gfo/Idh/MocA family oxidoreductase [Planctomycetota bacterium]